MEIRHDLTIKWKSKVLNGVILPAPQHKSINLPLPEYKNYTISL